MEFGWAVLAKRTIIEEGTNLLTLVDTVDAFIIHQDAGALDAEIQTAIAEGHKGLAININCVLATWWFRSNKGKAETGQARARIVDPSGEELHTTEFDVKLEKGFASRVMVQLKLFPLKRVGLHFVVLDAVNDAAEWVQVSRLPVDMLLDSPNAPSAPVQPSGRTRGARRR